MIKVMIAEDQGMMRDALALLLALEDDLEIVAQAQGRSGGGVGRRARRSTIADVAARRHLSESTVRNHLASAIGKTHTRNRIEAAQLARHNGWL